MIVYRKGMQVHQTSGANAPRKGIVMLVGQGVTHFIQSIDVRWEDGSVSVWPSLAADQWLTIIYPDANDVLKDLL